MVAILIVNRKLINPGGKKIIKMERLLNQNVLLKKKTNRTMNRIMIMIVMKMIILILILIKEVQTLGITLNVEEDHP